MKSNRGWRWRTFVAVVLGAIIGPLALLVPQFSNAVQAQVPPETPTSPEMTFSASVTCVGGILDIKITGLKPGSPVQIFMHRTVLAPPPAGQTSGPGSGLLGICLIPSLGGILGGLRSINARGVEAQGADVHAAAGGTFNTNADAVLIASGFADAGGTFNTKATIPDDILPGYHQVTANVTDAQGTARELSGEMLVLPKGPAVPVGVLANQISGKQAAGDLARTGSNSVIPLALGAGVLIMVGAALVLATRRRRLKFQA